MKFDEKTGFLTVTHENREISFRVSNGIVEYTDNDRHRWAPSHHATEEEEAMYTALRNMHDTGNAQITQDSSRLLRPMEAVTKEQINTPELTDFIRGIQLEALHQRQRWGTNHDQGKTPEDWLWLLAYLATKASQASRYNDQDKYLHHIITCAAACLNWHANASGINTEMKPGAPEPLLPEEGK